jgi:hypothetical protein
MHIRESASYLPSHVLFLLQASGLGHRKKMSGKSRSAIADSLPLPLLKGKPCKVPLSCAYTQNPSFVKGWVCCGPPGQIAPAWLVWHEKNVMNKDSYKNSDMCIEFVS